MPLDINSFIQALKGEGARPSRFEIKILFPSFADGGQAGQPFTAICHKANFPGSNLGDIALGYQGRKIYLAGDRTFDPWTATLYVQTDFNVRNAFERWMSGINQHEGNNQSDPNFRALVTITQYDQDYNTVLKEVQLVDAFPTKVSEIDLDWDSNDRIETFDVTLRYNYWRDTGLGITGEATTDL